MILCWPRPTWQKNQQIGDSYASVVVQPCHKHVIPHLTLWTTVYQNDGKEEIQGPLQPHPGGFYMPTECTSLWRKGSSRWFSWRIHQQVLHLRLCLNQTVLAETKQRREGVDYWLQILYARAKSELESKLYFEWKKHRKIIKQIWMAKHPHSWIFYIISAVATVYIWKLEKHFSPADLFLSSVYSLFCRSVTLLLTVPTAPLIPSL